MTADTHSLRPGTSALLISLPHVGTRIPQDQRRRYVERALEVEDTDWHLDQLYDFAATMGAGLIVPQYSRFLIDLNRSPDNRPMYAGANNTELCPTRFFTGEPLYRSGQEPDADEIAHRRAVYWQPYHDALEQELARLKARYGYAVLFDGHSIKSTLPWLFEGKLPDLNLGTSSGASCAADLRAALTKVLQTQTRFTQVTDGRFSVAVLAVLHQREMCRSTYMQEAAPYRIDPLRAAELAPVLRALVQTMIDWRPHA